jgi:hypothetical protein
VVATWVDIAVVRVRFWFSQRILNLFIEILT